MVIFIVAFSNRVVISLKALCHYIVRAVTKNRLDVPCFPYSLRTPQPYSSAEFARQLRFEALFWMASEGGSGLLQLPTSSLEIYTIDWSILQTFRHWKPYLYLVFYRSIPESSAPRLKQKKVRLGFIKSKRCLSCFLGTALSQQQGQASNLAFFVCVYQWRKLYLELQ